MTPLTTLPAAAARHALQAAMNLPPALLKQLAGTPISVAGRQLDTQAQVIVRLLRALQRPYNDRTVEGIRREFDFFVRVSETEMPHPSRLRDIEVSGRHGRIPITLVAPGIDHTPAPPTRPCIVYFHGGGFVIGSRRTAMAHCGRLADATGAMVANVEYRLAPEHKFPTAIDDAFDALRSLQAQADQWNLDAMRLALAGDSAGATIAAVVAHQARDARMQGLRAQWLIYPVTLVGAQTASRKNFESGFLLEQRTIDWFCAQYLTPGSAEDPRASPLLSSSFEGLPPTVVTTAGFDPLCDEGIAYARKLRSAGVSVAEYSYPTIHGFINMPAMHYARTALEEAATALRAALE